MKWLREEIFINGTEQRYSAPVLLLGLMSLSQRFGSFCDLNYQNASRVAVF